ncbi:MAG TPA: HAMP domain-containing sensor histidine kinase [Terriglobales bacterium]|jgi:signal transduction histidine kinase|nr:HAMP domain-containing sensor histidine kinase [Terriglobales bacterium]
MSVVDKAEQGLKSRARPPRPRALSASAAHEINNPLDSLLNLLYLLESEPLTQKGRRHLTLAEEEVRRISQIARESLEQNKSVATRERTDVGKVLAGVLDFFNERLKSSAIVVKARYSARGTIRAYDGQLRQAFSNLLLNSMEAMPQGGTIHANVYAGHEWCGKQRRGIRVTIADNGCGIRTANIAKIFQRFFTTKPSGSGLGLSLVADVIQKHKGFVRVKSSTRPDRHGTVFALFVPAA